MTNPTEIPSNWQDGAETVDEGTLEEQLNAAIAVLESNLIELKEAFERGELEQDEYDQLVASIEDMKEHMERGEMPDFGMNPDEPVPAVVGMLAEGMVSLFTPMGASMWSIDDPNRLASLLGRGIVPRTLTPSSGMREVGMLNLTEGVFTVAERLSDEERNNPEKSPWQGHPAVGEPMLGEKLPDGTEVYVRTHSFNLTAPEDTEENPWLDVEAFLRRLAVEAPARGEYIVVEKASSIDQAEPGQQHPSNYVLFGVFPGESDDEDQAVIETYPHPGEVQFWDQVQPAPSGPTMVAAAANTELEDQGSIATVAAASWGSSPWDLVVSYAPTPPRPGTPEAEVWEQAMREAQEAAAAAAVAAEAAANDATVVDGVDVEEDQSEESQDDSGIEA